MTQPHNFIMEARTDCARCGGTGMLSRDYVCRCVNLNVFRAVHARFRECIESTGFCAPVSLERTTGPTGRCMYGLKSAEFIADFCGVARRTLSDDEYRLFRFFFLLGADWKQCCRILGRSCTTNNDKKNFFFKAHGIERKLGIAFRTLQPYPLWPTADYFEGTVAA